MSHRYIIISYLIIASCITSHCIMLGCAMSSFHIIAWYHVIISYHHVTFRKNLRKIQKKNPKKPLQNSLSPTKSLSEHKNLLRQIRTDFLHHCCLVYTQKGRNPRGLLPLTLYSVVGGTLGKMWEGIDAKAKEYACGFLGGHRNPRGFP